MDDKPKTHEIFGLYIVHSIISSANSVNVYICR